MGGWATTLPLLGGLAACLAMAWEDLSRREVALHWFVLLAVCGVWSGLGEGGSASLAQTGLNLLFVALVFGVLALWARLRGMGPLMDHAIGWGDLAALAAFAAWVPLPGFVLFYLTGLAFSLLWLGGMRIARGPEAALTVPLAGLLALWAPAFAAAWRLWLQPLLLP